MEGLLFLLLLALLGLLALPVLALIRSSVVERRLTHRIDLLERRLDLLCLDLDMERDRVATRVDELVHVH